MLAELPRTNDFSTLITSSKVEHEQGSTKDDEENAQNPAAARYHVELHWMFI